MSYPILYEQIDNIGTVPNNNGLGVLTDCLECMITEERNGIYELEMKYPASGIHSKELIERRIIKAKPNYTDDPQLFRIYKITKVLNGSFTIYARHISYDLSGYSITSGNANSCVLACDLLQNNASGWTIDTDKEVLANFTIYEPSSVRSWFGGKEGSFLDVFGTGEWKYNNFTCSFLQHRGINRGVTVKYAKNLLSLNQDKDSSNIITAVIAYWKDSQDDTVVISDTQTTSVTLDVPNVYVLDCSYDFQNTPTKAQLNDKALNYINNNETAFAKENIKLDFLQIGQLKDRVDLCDIVTIDYEDFGISGTAKCITTTWDVLKDRYDSIEIGEPKTNIADTIISVQKNSQNAITQTQMNGAIDRATALITGNSGGYVVLHDSNSDGQPDELLIMNTSDITTATKVWRWNLSGLGYSNTGYDGTYGLAMTMDGAINADYIKTGTLVFGGTVGNTDGSLTIKDNDNNIIANFNKSGCTVKGNIYATSFVADAGSDTEIHIGNLPADTESGYAASNGIYIFDENLEGGDIKPIINLSNSISTIILPEGSLHTKVGQLILGTPYKFPSGNYGLLRLIHLQAAENVSQIALYTEAFNTSYESIVLTALPSSDGYGYGVLKVAGLHQRGIYYNGNVPNQIYLGPIYVSNGILQGVSGDYLKGIYLKDSSGTSRGKFQLDSSGNGTFYLFKSNASTSNIGMSGSSGNITCVSLTQTSTKKVKKNIKKLSDTEAKKILDITPVTYDFKDEDYGTDKRGFIAEDVDKVIPNIVTKDEDNNPQGINYTEIIPYLTKMIQIQQEQINKLEARVKELEERSI